MRGRQKVGRNSRNLRWRWAVYRNAKDDGGAHLSHLIWLRHFCVALISLQQHPLFEDSVVYLQTVRLAFYIAALLLYWTGSQLRTILPQI
jgi:hypothetical protein